MYSLISLFTQSSIGSIIFSHNKSSIHPFYLSSLLHLIIYVSMYSRKYVVNTERVNNVTTIEQLHVPHFVTKHDYCFRGGLVVNLNQHMYHNIESHEYKNTYLACIHFTM